jgi:hypothetical protein
MATIEQITRTVPGGRRKPTPTLTPREAHREFLRPAGIHGLLGDVAWRRLPAAVRTRFGEPVLKVDYVGEFDVVRASIVGRVIAWLCKAIGTPVVPRTGERVPAVIHVGPVDRGASWLREYRWPHGRTCQVRSTKVVGADGTIIEELPAGLRMPLNVYQRRGVLHFVSTGYYFEFWLGLTAAAADALASMPGLLGATLRTMLRVVGFVLGTRGAAGGTLPIKIPLPSFLSPGITHVEHADESRGWFRFTMTVTHPLFGEVFYQTGRFRAVGDPL